MATSTSREVILAIKHGHVYVHNVLEHALAGLVNSACFLVHVDSCLLDAELFQDPADGSGDSGGSAAGLVVLSAKNAGEWHGGKM